MTTAAPVAFRDRSLRLALFGATAVVVGAACVALGAAHVLLLFAAKRVAGLRSLAIDARSAVMGAVTYVGLGAAFIAVGAGSIRKRRWVRPMMLILAWSWLAAGVLAFVMVPRVLDGLLATGELEAGVAGAAIKGVVLAVGAIFGVLLPALFVWVYRDRDLLLTCQAHDPVPSWTDGCPLAVLGLSVGMAAGAVLALPMVARPVVPVFGVLATGWLGLVLLGAGALASAWLAWATYHTKMSGWWGSTALLGLTGVSTMVTLQSVAPMEFYRALGYSGPELEVLSEQKTLAVVVTGLFTLASLGYMLWIRKYFLREGPR